MTTLELSPASSPGPSPGVGGLSGPPPAGGALLAAAEAQSAQAAGAPDPGLRVGRESCEILEKIA